MSTRSPAGAVVAAVAGLALLALWAKVAAGRQSREQRANPRIVELKRRKRMEFSLSAVFFRRGKIGDEFWRRALPRTHASRYGRLSGSAKIAEDTTKEEGATQL